MKKPELSTILIVLVVVVVAFFAYHKFVNPSSKG